MFKELLNSGRKVLTVEYNPPKGIGIDTNKIDQIRRYIDGVNVTDCPMANLRMNSVSASVLIKQKTNLAPVFNITCRDKNALAVSSELLGAYELGLRNILAVNGDAVMDNFSENIYQINTYGLIDIINKLNQGTDYRGRQIKGKTDFFIGAASNIPKKITIKGIANRLKRKESFGAKFVITQPVYSVESLDCFLAATKDTKMFKIIGLFAPPNLNVARYLDKFVKGINIPSELFNSFEKSKDEKQAGFRFIENLIERIVDRGYMKHIDGMHLMRYDEIFVKNIFDIMDK